jgi:hypothetical protein
MKLQLNLLPVTVGKLQTYMREREREKGGESYENSTHSSSYHHQLTDIISNHRRSRTPPQEHSTVK